MTAMAERTWDVDAAQAVFRGPGLPVLALGKLVARAGPQLAPGMHQRARDGQTTVCPLWLLGCHFAHVVDINAPRLTVPRRA
jgi:hypothetical protein